MSGEVRGLFAELAVVKLPEVDPEIDAALVTQVDRAVKHYNGVRAAESVGHFLRHGRPGPSRFESPASVRPS
jgi:hypothetical protein